jgi:hypothetical protein
MTAAPAISADDVVARMGRWVLAKVWLGCMLCGAYALGRHFGWPQAVLTTAAVLGAMTLALAAWWLPHWTARATTGVAIVDVGLRVIVWGGLAACVVALLIGMPAVGAVAAALLINTAARTFHPHLAPLLRRCGIDVDALRRGHSPSRIKRPDRPAWSQIRRRRPAQRMDQPCPSKPTDQHRQARPTDQPHGPRPTDRAHPARAADQVRSPRPADQPVRRRPARPAEQPVRRRQPVATQDWARARTKGTPAAR